MSGTSVFLYNAPAWCGGSKKYIAMSPFVQPLSDNTYGEIRTNITTGMRKGNSIVKRDHFSCTGGSGSKGGLFKRMNVAGNWAL